MTDTTFTLTPEYILKHWPTQGALWLMEDPLLFENHSDAFIEALEEAIDTPTHESFMADVLHMCAQTMESHRIHPPDPRLHSLADVIVAFQKAIAENRHTPLHMLQTLTLGTEWSVRHAVYAHPHILAQKEIIQDLVAQIQNTTSTQILSDFAMYWHVDVRIAVAKNLSTPLDVLIQLAAQADASVKIALAQNPRTPEDILMTMEAYQAVEQNPIVASVIETISVSAEKSTEKSDPLGKPNSPETLELLEKHTKHWNRAVRHAVAQHPATPPHLLAMLASDRHYQVRHAAAQHVNTPEKSLQTLFDDRAGEVVSAVNKHPWVKAETQRTREMQNPEHLQQQATHWHDYVRRAVAENIHTPSAVLLQLTKDRAHPVRVAAVDRIAQNPALLGVLDQLVTEDTDTHTLMAIAESSHIPADLVLRLAQHPKELVRSTIAHSIDPTRFTQSSTALENLLETLAQDTDAGVRQCVAGNLHTPTHILEKLATEKDMNICAAVAENPHTPPHLLEKLAQDARRSDVYEAILENPNTPAHVREVLLEKFAASK